MRKDLVPDVSLGTHFLNELVEMNMLYLALFPDRGGNRLDTSFFLGAPNRLTRLVPGADGWEDTLRVIESRDLVGKGEAVVLTADAVKQRVVCFRDRTGQQADRAAAG
jgi:hypothetical protein